MQLILHPEVLGKLRGRYGVDWEKKCDLTPTKTLRHSSFFSFFSNMNDAIIRQKIAETKVEMEKHLHQVQILKVRLDTLSEIAADNTAAAPRDRSNGTSNSGTFRPDISVTAAFLKTVIELKEFTKLQAVEAMAKKFPTLGTFNPKSIERPLSVLMKEGKVDIAKPNIGNRHPAIYTWVGDAIRRT